MTEGEYQTKLIKKIERRFPGCVVMKNDAAYKQGMLDLTVLYQDMWAMLEVKRSRTATLHVNQEFFVQQLDEMSFAAVIYPENEMEVLDALQNAFEPQQRTRIS